MTQKTSLRGGELLLRILTYTRDGREIPRREPTPQEWGTWAGRQYASILHQKRPPSELYNKTPVWDPKKKVLRYPLRDMWARVLAYQRKLMALHLFTLANERVGSLPDGSPDPDSPWHPQAQRWADVYFGLPGADPPDTPGSREKLADLRCYEEALRVTLARPDRLLQPVHAPDPMRPSGRLDP